MWVVAITGCGKSSQADQNIMYVSIAPLQQIVSSIVGADFEVKVLVPPGASPETFEPTPRQMIEVEQARMVFNVGLLDYEQMLMKKLSDTHKIVDLSRGIEVIAGSCSHTHANSACAHGVDPHIWTSPRQLLKMADNAYREIHRSMPDSTKYSENYATLRERLQELDKSVSEACNSASVKYFVIYHPALTYYARDYEMEQIAIESEGKEPSAKRLSRIIERVRTDGVHSILYQSQYPRSTVETICSDAQAQAVEIDPLRADVIENIAEITRIITAQ